MFYNNKAAETFDRYNFAQTYRYYLAAIAADPAYAVTWSNLAVLYRQQNLYTLAEQVYHHSLALDPTSTNALANLAVLYRYNGNINAARQLEQQVHEKRKSNPWYYVMLGNEAVKRNELNEAIAAQSLAVINTLGLNPANVNPMGGAIALGHPLGATGAIRAATVVHALRRHKLKYGMVTMCVGTGQGAAGIIEAL